MGEELVGLEDHADAAAHLGPGDAGLSQVGPVEEDLPGVDGLEAVDRAQERGLAAAGRADDNNDFAVGYVEGDAAQGVVPAGVGLVEVDEAQLRLARARVGRGRGGLVRATSMRATSVRATSVRGAAVASGSSRAVSGGQFCHVFSMWRERSEMGQQMRKYSAKIRP